MSYIERWIEVPNNSRYLVSDLGNVFDDAKVRHMAQTMAGVGYLRVTLDYDGVRVPHYVHRLVAMCFLSADLDGLDVNHLDGDKQNNALSNLAVCTHAENMRHAYATGLKTPAGGRAKTPVRCLETGAEYASATEAAQQLGLHRTAVSSVLRGLRHTANGLHFEHISSGA